MHMTIFMKSGNQIELPGVKEYEIGNQGDVIVKLKIVWSWWKTGPRLLVKTIALSQIEAITVT